MIIAALAASAQSAERGTPHKEQNRKTSRTTASVTKGTENRSVENKIDGNIVNRESRKTSTTNHLNPRSDYRSPNTTVNAGKTYLDPKQRKTTVVHKPTPVVTHNKSRYVYNRYYPSKRVKIHVHPVTYHHHYTALYYPAHRDIIWTNRMHRHYIGLYPNRTWRYPVGYHLQTISVFEARHNIGEIARVYGRVYATWFNRETDDLLLFFGGEFPNQEFTMIVPGNIARRFNWRPERYFLGQHVFATGLITSFDGKSEMVVKKRSQLDVY